MAKPELWVTILRMSNNNLSKEENILLEVNLFELICNELFEWFRVNQQNFFRLMNYTLEMENQMLETNFVKLIITDILQTEEYTLQGIAQYTQIHEDVINELALGINVNPSVVSFRKILQIHQSVRRDIYEGIRQKLLLSQIS